MSRRATKPLITLRRSLLYCFAFRLLRSIFEHVRVCRCVCAHVLLAKVQIFSQTTLKKLRFLGLFMCLGSIFCNKSAQNDDFGSNNSILFGKLSCNGVKVPLRYGEISRNCVPLRLEWDWIRTYRSWQTNGHGKRDISVRRTMAVTEKSSYSCPCVPIVRNVLKVCLCTL